jgi:hypothetical protein
MFVGMLDSETVKLFVWPYYLTLFAWGIYGSFFAAPPTIVLPAMGRIVYNLWVWQHMTGTSLVMIGLLWPNKYIGLWLQLGGNFTMFLVLLAYEVSGIYESWWGQGTYSLFAIAPYVLGCLFLAMTCVRKLYLVRKTQKQIEEGILP